MYLLKQKQMAKRKFMKIFWVSRFYQEDEKEREILEALLWIFTYGHNSVLKI